MKKVYLLCLITVLAMLRTVNVYGQNRCVLKSSSGTERVITSSYDMSVFQIKDNEAMIHYKTEVKPQVKGSKATHTLNVYPPSQYIWNQIFVSDGQDLLAEMYSYQGDHLTVELEEGTYYVLCDGRIPSEDFNCMWLGDDIVLDEDKEVYVNFDECIHSIMLDLVDENGNSFDGVSFVDIYYRTFLVWQGGVMVVGRPALAPFYFGQIPDIRFNSFSERSAIVNNLTMDIGNQKSYFYQCPQLNGLSQTETLRVGANEMTVVQENITVNNAGETSFYFLNDREYDMNGGCISTEGGWNREQIFNPELPYTIVSNAKKAGPADTQTFFRKYQLRPCIHERYDYDGAGPGYADDLVNTFSLDGYGNVTWEATPFFRNIVWPASFPDWFPSTPLSMTVPAAWNPSFGERTPLAVYHPAAFNASNTPMDKTFFNGGFYYTGERSCERLTDYDSNIQVLLDWQPAYSNPIHQFNENNYFETDPCEVIVDVDNMHLSANGIPKINHTQVFFDLNKEDAMPPTMTFLKVIGERGLEYISLPNLSQSSVIFGCADFSYHFQETSYGGRYDHLVYNGKPDVRLNYSVNGGDWTPLEFREEPSLFHQNYGNVFVVDLAQLENIAVDAWVTLKFDLQDEAGNRQTQLLTSLFYAGDLTDVNEEAEKTHIVYPNPFTDKVKITTDDAVNGTAHVMLYNLLGELVYSRTENCSHVQEFSIDGRALKPGVYFYCIDTDQGLLQGKIVKE